jgi:hypothetical protein
MACRSPLSRGQALAAFAHLDTDQHPLGFNIADPQHDDLAVAQTGAPGLRRGKLQRC